MHRWVNSSYRDSRTIFSGPSPEAKNASEEDPVLFKIRVKNVKFTTL